MRAGCDLFPLMYLENENGPKLRFALIFPLGRQRLHLNVAAVSPFKRSGSAGLDLSEKV